MTIKNTTITISTGLRNRIRRSKDITSPRSYEDFLKRLMDRDRSFTNDEKSYTNKDNIISLKERLKHFEKTHNYCERCGVVFEKINGYEYACPYCMADMQDELEWEKVKLIVFTQQRNKLNRQISTLKKANLN